MKGFFKKIANGIKKFFELITNKWLLKGTTTIIVVAIVIAGYIGINWGAEQLKVEDLDFTTNKLYSLSDETKERLKSLESEITIQLINMKDFTYYDYYYSGQLLLDGNYVIDYAKKYEAVNEKITVEEVNDLETRNDLQEKYGITTENAIIVLKNGEEEKILTINDLIAYDYEEGAYKDKTEEALTNAFVELTIEEKQKIYVYNGNTWLNAKESMAIIATTLIKEANEVTMLDILTTGNIPEDCDCLIITTLAKDFTEKERDEILKYINNGGKILMLTAQCSFDKDMPNFDQVLAQYGINLEYGIVYEQDSNKRIADAPNYIVANARASFMDEIGMSLRMFLLNAGKINFADETKLEELGVTYETIASTSTKSFVRTDFNQETLSRTNKDSEEGSCIVGAYVTKELAEGKSSKLIIYSDEIFASTSSLPILNMGTYALYIYNNEDIVLNSVYHLIERTDNITIRKTEEVETYTVTDQEDVIIKTIIFTTPVLVIIIGIAVWIYRRRKI